MRKFTRWFGVMASSATLALAGCTSTTGGRGSVASSGWHWPWSTPAAAPVYASTTDPTSLSCKAPKPGPDLYVATARIYERTGDPSAAAGNYQKALHLDPGNLPALLGYAQLQDSQRMYVEADKLYQEAIKRHPKEAAVYNDRGLSYDLRGRHEDAARMFARAVHLQPEKQLYRNNMATVLVEMHRNSDALTQLAAVHGPAGAHYNLAILLHRQHNDVEAQYHFAEAAQIDPALLVAREWAQRLSPSSRPATQIVSDQRLPSNRPPVASPPYPAQQPLIVSDANRQQIVQPQYVRAPVEVAANIAPQPSRTLPDPVLSGPQLSSAVAMRYPQYAPPAAAGAAIPPSPDGLNALPPGGGGLQPLPPIR